jgi:menaquinone-dependent protoporphyrinogen oxidase
MAKYVLVAAASKHGATLDIADVISGVLSHRGLEVIDKQVDEIADLRGIDAAVIGSAVYVGRWMAEAVSFVNRFGSQLSAMPVWLFSSGPVGDPLKPEGEPEGAVELAGTIKAREHRVFGGRLEPDRLGIGEKLIVGMLKAPQGDFRDLDEVRAWANHIADELERQPDPVVQVEPEQERAQEGVPAR